MNEQLQAIANSYAEEYHSDAIYPAHLFKAILHKEIGLVRFIETDLGKDYYYLLDWADVQIQLAPRAVRPMRDLELSDESREVMDEAENYKVKFNLDETEPVCILAALVTPGVGFSFDQLNTLPLTPSDISAKMGGANVEAPYMEGAELHKSTPAKGKGTLAKYCTNVTAVAQAGNLDNVVGFEKEIGIIYEILGRKTKANLLITGEAGVGKTSLVHGFVRELAAGKVPGFFTLSTPTKDGYSFVGWNEPDSTQIQDIVTIVQGTTGDKTYIANWNPILPYASITTDPIGADSLVYTGGAQALLSNGGEADGGTLKYSLNNTDWVDTIPTGTAAGDYTVYYMVEGDTSHTDFTPSPNTIEVTIADFSGNGTEDSPYLIPSTEVWDHLADKVQANTDFAGKYFRQTADISVTTMVGTNSHRFSGTYDGDEHTLKVNINSTEQYAAPFGYVKDNTTIMNLHVADTIRTSAKFAGGIIGGTNESDSKTATCCSLINCRSSVIIISSVNGDGTHGGLVGILYGSNHTLMIEGCVLDGSLIGSSTNKWGGFVGWSGSKNNISIENSLFAPDSVNINTEGCQNFARAYFISEAFGTFTNNYYTSALNGEQGKQAYSIIADEGVTVENAGVATVYRVSGITSYGTGISYKGVLYAGNEEAISLNLSGWTDYKASAGTLTGTANPYTLTMPAEDVIITGSSIPTAIDNSQCTMHNSQCTKVLRDGQLFILRGNKVYTVTGQELR